jgi:hypothetical protein
MMSIHAVPTPDEIEAVLWKLIATEITHAFERGEDLDPFWQAKAINPQGKEVVYSIGNNRTEALVKVWLSAWSEQLNCSVAPVDVPEGWTFEVCAPGEEMAVNFGG